jgi:carbamoyltransferase
MKELGISCFYHESADSLLENGKITAAVQEERFSRIKHDSSFPFNSVSWISSDHNIDINDLGCIAYYEHPVPKKSEQIGPYFVHAFSDDEIRNFLPAHPYPNMIPADLAREVATFLTDGNVMDWFQFGME